MFRRFDRDDQRVANFLGTGCPTTCFAGVVVNIENRVVEAAAAHALRAMQHGFPLTHVGAAFLLSRVLLHIEETFRISVCLAVLDLLVIGPEYCLQSSARIGSRILRIGGRGIAKRRREPDVAVQATGGQWVFVLSADGSEAVRRNIRIGRQNPQYYEVLEGLTPGEKVIVSGYEMFGDNTRLELR